MTEESHGRFQIVKLRLVDRLRLPRVSRFCYTVHMTIILELPEDLLSSARMSVDELRIELAIALYASRRLSIGKARELANMPLWQFRQILAGRRITVDLPIEELESEIATLRHLDRL